MDPLSARPSAMLRRDELPLLLTGLAATLSGIGMARFAYTALMPHMVQAGWFSGGQAAYLGAANLLGYLLGALLAASLAARLGTWRVLRACWVTVTLSFALCAWPVGGMAWFGFWRFASGMAGAILMVLGPSVAMAATPAGRRAALGPLVFCGVGVGALLSATLVAPLARHSLTAVWLLLALLCVAAAWCGWRQEGRLAAAEIAPAPTPAVPPPGHAAPLPPGVWSLPVLLLVVAYMCDAFGFVPHTVFWVDYLERERQLGSGYAATQWALFGLGAIAGPLVVAFCVTRWGWWASTFSAYVLKTMAVALPLLWASFAGHALSSIVVGALSPGMAAITSGYLMQLVGPQQHKKLWGQATAAFALTQAASGYFMAWRYASTGSYQTLFAWAAASLLLGTLMVLGSRVVAGK